MSKLGKRIFAWAYRHLMGHKGEPDMSDPFTRDQRAPLLGRAQGDVLEIGAGTGSNLPFYDRDVQLTLLEPNPYMIQYLEEECGQHPPTCAEIVEGIGEDLPFHDGRFDTVVITHVLCSVESQQQVLAEVKRVLRPGGRFLFLEHVAAPDSKRQRLQKAINPLWKRVGDGCHLTRDTGAAIREAGFRRVEVTDVEADYPGLVSPHVVGWAEA